MSSQFSRYQYKSMRFQNGMDRNVQYDPKSNMATWVVKRDGKYCRIKGEYYHYDGLDYFLPLDKNEYDYIMSFKAERVRYTRPDTQEQYDNNQKDVRKRNSENIKKAEEEFGKYVVYEGVLRRMQYSSYTNKGRIDLIINKKRTYLYGYNILGHFLIID